MHGVIHKQLQAFASERAGDGGWEAVRAAAGVPAVRYVTSVTYPDDEIPALLVALSKSTGRRLSDLVEEFGQHLAPALIERYRVFVEPDWRTLDLVEHTEEVIHRAVRASDPRAHPPALRTSRPSATEVRVIYTSPRRLCPLAKGIVRGVASYYGDRVTITDEACMLAGDDRCEMVVTAA